MGGVFHVRPFEVAAAAAVIENQLGQLGLLGKSRGEAGVLRIVLPAAFLADTRN